MFWLLLACGTSGPGTYSVTEGYYVSVVPEVVSAPRRGVMFLHGHGGDAAELASRTAWLEELENFGVIGVFPQGEYEGNWAVAHHKADIDRDGEETDWSDTKAGVEEGLELLAEARGCEPVWEDTGDCIRIADCEPALRICRHDGGHGIPDGWVTHLLSQLESDG